MNRIQMKEDVMHMQMMCMPNQYIWLFWPHWQRMLLAYQVQKCTESIDFREV